MLLLLIEAGILIFLLKTIVDEDISILSALLLTVVTLVGMNGLVFLFSAIFVGIFSPVLGVILALLLGGGIAAVGLGAAVSLLYGAPLKTRFFGEFDFPWHLYRPGAWFQFAIRIVIHYVKTETLFGQLLFQPTIRRSVTIAHPFGDGCDIFHSGGNQKGDV